MTPVLDGSGDDWSSPFGYQPMPGPWASHGYDTHWLQSADMFFVLMLVSFWLNSQHLRGFGHYVGERALARLFRWVLRRPAAPERAEAPLLPEGRRGALEAAAAVRQAELVPPSAGSPSRP